MKRQARVFFAPPGGLKGLFSFAGKRTALILLAPLLLSTAGCAWLRVEPEARYLKVLHRWTQSEKVFKDLESRLYISATYKSPSFREAYIEEYARRYMLDEDYKKLLMEREMGEAGRYNEFFVSAYTPSDVWNDFDERDSIWRLYLEDSSGARVVPVEIERVERNDPLLREFFPYFDPWSEGYIVRFPKYTEQGAEMPAPDTEFIRLVVTGVLGGGELVWSFTDFFSSSQQAFQ